VLFVPRNDFRSCCLEHPEVSLKVLLVMGARLRRLVGIIDELPFTRLRHRLIAWLLREAQARGSPTPLGIVFEPGMNHQEIAAYIGTVRELVSRNMAGLQAQGTIRVQGREITLLDREG
jgi:CRP-like cAMP-binding protein